MAPCGWPLRARGMLKYDRGSRRLVRYQNHPEDNESLGADSVINLYEDDESNKSG